MASRVAKTNKADMMRRGRKPANCFPGSLESCFVGSPKKYLRGPALVMTQETASDPRVASRRTRGNVPE